MRKTVALPFVAIALAAVVAAGCSGTAYNPATNAPTPAPSPTVSCSTSMFPAGETVQQVFPQNGMTGVPNVQGVVFDVAPAPLPTNWYIYATTTTPSGVTTSTAGTSSIAFLATPGPIPGSTAGATPSPLPTPSDAPSPGFGSPIINETASIGTFAVSTQFTIFLANTNCFPGIPMSSFTTSTVDLPSPSPTPTST